MALDMRRIEAGENLTTEFKREYNEEVKKTIVAFANTAGGTLYIGINDDKTITGVANPEDTLLQITNAIHSAIKPDITLFVDYKTEKKRKAAVIVVTVQKGTACPYFLAGKDIRPEGVYVRKGTSSVPASETTILNMIKETDGEKYEEVRSLNQDLTFNATKQFFKTVNVPFGLNQQSLSICRLLTAYIPIWVSCFRINQFTQSSWLSLKDLKKKFLKTGEKCQVPCLSN